MSDELTVWDAISITAANNKNKDRHRYTVDELFEIYPILQVANLTEFYPDLERLKRRVINSIGGDQN